MRLAAIFFLLLTVEAYSSEGTFQEFFHFIETEQNRLLAPKFNEKECHQTIPEEKTEFNAAQCVRDICGEKEAFPFGLGESDFSMVTCALAEEGSLASKNCSEVSKHKHFKEFKEIAKEMKGFYLSQLQLTGHKLKAAVSFLKNPETPNSPVDNLQLNVGDLLTYIMEVPKFLDVETSEDGFKVTLKNESRLKRKLRWRFNLRTKEEQRVAIKAIKAFFEDGNSILALEYLGPGYVLDNLIKDRELTGDTTEVLKKMKYESLAKLQKILGSETIDPEYTVGADKEVTDSQENLLGEVLALEALTKNLTPADLRILSKPNFPKKRFYNRTKFERDWTDPNANLYVTTLQHLEELSKIYVGDDERVRDSDLYAYLNSILSGLKLLPSQEEVDKIKAKVPDFIDGFFNDFNQEFSTESTGIIKAEVGKLHIDYPDSQKEYLEKIKRWLEYKKAVADDSLKKLRDPNNKKAIAFFGRDYLQSLLLERDAEGDLTSLSTLVSVNPIPDFYIGVYNGIKMGAFAVTEFDQAGKQVLAHELGHHVGHFMEENPLSIDTTKEFKSVRQCLASAYPDEKTKVSMKLKSLKRKTHKWKENKYTEEDFADWIGAKTSSHNMGCLFVKNLDTEQSKKDLFQNQHKTDTHSSAFFRLINIEIQQKGKIPKSCQNDIVKLCSKAQDK